MITNGKRRVWSSHRRWLVGFLVGASTFAAGRAAASTLSVEGEAIAGATVRLRAEGLAPGAWTAFGASLQGIGAGPCRGATCLGITAPRLLGSVAAGADGVAVLDVTAAGAAGTSVWLQAAAVGNVSNVVPVVLLADADGDGYGAGGLDCDDSDAGIHPGTPESCSDLSGGFAAEDADVGGGGDCAGAFGTPSGSAELVGVPWQTQLVACDDPARPCTSPGTPNDTHICGPVATAQAVSFFTGEDPEAIAYRIVVDRLGQQWSSGANTGLSDLTAALDAEGIAYEVLSFTADALLDELAIGRPVLVPSLTQYTSNDPGGAFESGDLRLGCTSCGHWVTAVGIDADGVRVNDPGRSEANAHLAEYREFPIAEFAQAWCENSSTFRGISIHGPAAPATLSVRSPAGGEAYALGQSIAIEWASTGVVSDVWVQVFNGPVGAGDASELVVAVEAPGADDGIVPDVVLDPATFWADDDYYVCVSSGPTGACGAAFSILASGVDLFVDDLVVADHSVTVADFVDLASYIVGNLGGAAPAGSVTYRVYASADGDVTTSDVEVNSVVVNPAAVAPGASNGGFATAFPASTPGPGTWFVGVVIDPDDLHAEDSESNNVTVDPVPVVISP